MQISKISNTPQAKSCSKWRPIASALSESIFNYFPVDSTASTERFFFFLLRKITKNEPIALLRCFIEMIKGRILLVFFFFFFAALFQTLHQPLRGMPDPNPKKKGALYRGREHTCEGAKLLQSHFSVFSGIFFFFFLLKSAKKDARM